MKLAADLGTDPRFDVVVDWTDYRLVRDSGAKDALTHEIIRWVNEEDYIMHDNIKGTLGKLIWKTRELKFTAEYSIKSCWDSKFRKEVRFCHCYDGEFKNNG